MEENKTAQTTDNSEIGSHADAGQNNEVVDNEFSDTPKNEVGKPVQTKEQNSENARRRREAERKAELEATRTSAIIEALGGKNPYTGESMSDATDVEEFLDMQAIEKNGGDPLTDYAKYQKEKRRKDEAKNVKSLEEDEWFKSDLASFIDKYPDVEVDKLVENEDFRIFVGKRVGEIPLSDLYEAYVEVTSRAERRAEEKAARQLANKNASVGALAGTNPTNDSYFSKEQVKSMSQKDVAKNLDKIRESMKKW